VQAQGYQGARRSIQRYVVTWRTVGAAKETVPPLRPPSPRQVRGWLVRPDEARAPVQRAYLHQLPERCAAVHAAKALAVEFLHLVPKRDHGAFAAWLAKAETSDLREFRDFATGLAADRAAVEAALRLE
jgi:transposase